MVKLTIKLLVLAVVLHAAYRIVPVFFTYLKFRDALRETATYSEKRTVDEVIDRAVKIAAAHELPLDRQDFKVTRDKARTTIDTTYTVELEYFPRQYYPWTFVIHTEGEPPRYLP